jgi:hypothetical protein
MIATAGVFVIATIGVVWMQLLSCSGVIAKNMIATAGLV